MDGKNKWQKTSVKHIRYRLIGGCVNNTGYPTPLHTTLQKTFRIFANLKTHYGRGRMGTFPPLPTVTIRHCSGCPLFEFQMLNKSLPKSKLRKRGNSQRPEIGLYTQSTTADKLILSNTNLSALILFIQTLALYKSLFRFK